MRVFCCVLSGLYVLYRNECAKAWVQRVLVLNNTALIRREVEKLLEEAG